MLAAMGLLGLHDIHRANGIKNFLGICINSIAVLIFALTILSAWPEALLMAVGALAGGYFGASMAVRVGQAVGAERCCGDRLCDFLCHGLEAQPMREFGLER